MEHIDKIPTEEKGKKAPGKNYDLAQDIMPKDTKIQATFMHKDRFHK